MKKYNNKGLSGLCNLGNTCYINSCMQILSNIHELNEHIDDLKDNMADEKQNVDIVFLKEWKKLYDLMWKNNCVIAPNRFIKIIQIIAKEKNNDLFLSFQQNDVTEFLYFLLDCFHNGLKIYDSKLLNNQLKVIEKYEESKFVDFFKNHYKNNYSFIEYLFSGIYKIDYVDEKTKKIISTRYESFYMIDIPLHKLNLLECLDNYFEVEIMNEENNNQYYDDVENCYKDVQKITKIIHCPKILILQLKRWNNNLRKNQRIIHFDNEVLNVNKYTVLESSMNYKNNQINYELFGILNHQGNIFGGHYNSYIKNTNNNWYVFDDTQVNQLKNNNLKTNKNYVLFYRLMK